MSQPSTSFAKAIDAIDRLAVSLASIGKSPGCDPLLIDKLAMQLSALRHHACRDDASPRVVVLLGGTGTGKSTLLNRLVGAEVSRASSLRTFTAGGIAVTASSEGLGDSFAGLQVVESTSVPTRGVADHVTRVVLPTSLLPGLVLIDSPDLDGSIASHHAIADRLFRFADAALFVTTPEKYQMTEMWPFYKMARRYGVPSLFVMNKIDDPAAGEDFERRLRDKLDTSVSVFLVPRDDSTYAVDDARSLDALRETLGSLPPTDAKTRVAGQQKRVMDLAERIREPLEELRSRRENLDRAIEDLNSLTRPSADLDVGNVAADLQRRFHEKSILYLASPQRVLERLRQLPGLLPRLPRSTLDLLRGGQGGSVSQSARSDAGPTDHQQIAAKEAFQQHLAKLDEKLRPFDSEDTSWKIDSAQAAKIVEEEIEQLRRWMAERWDSEPRDTKLFRKLVGKLPGGETIASKVISASEATPYLLTLACIVKGAVFGPLDVAVLAIYSGVTTLLEKTMSDEVGSRVRQTNQCIANRFAKLVEQQVRQARQWLDAQAPRSDELEDLRHRVDQLLDAFSCQARGT